MKETKFRAWDKYDKKYIKRVLVGCNLKSEDYICNLVFDEKKMEWVHFSEENGTIEQYTGMKDKNGKEIFEGDRVSFIYTNSYGVTKLYYDSVITDISDFVLMQMLNRSNKITIIGNIHE